MTPVLKFASLRVVAATSAAVLFAASSLAAPVATAAPGSVAGMIVFLDPGHNGANDASITRQVSNGRGGTKDCQTSGTTTDDGYAEHTFNWDTTLRVRAILHRLGVRTAMSRGNDDALGPCIDERAAMANSLQPNAVVSIHADGGPATGRGFHILYATPPLNAAQAGPSVQLARMMRDQLAGSGIPPATYIGSSGLNPRADIAGLNLAQYPSILVELGQYEESGRLDADGEPRRVGRSTPTRWPAVWWRSCRPSRRGPADRRRRQPRSTSVLEVAQHLILDFAQAQWREGLLEETLDPAGAGPGGLDGDTRAGPAGATVQLVTRDELASFSMTVWPATSTSARTTLDRDLVACSRQGRRCPGPGRPSDTRYSLYCGDRIFGRTPW